MKRLQENRIEILSKYLQATKIGPELYSEILDHMACEAEERLWDGNSFQQALDGIKEAADPETLLFLSAETKHLLAMEKSLNDIVFENRNKLYGAYALRKGYKNTVQKSVLIGVTFFLLMIMLPNLYARLVPEKKKDDIAYVIEFKNVTIKPDVEPVKEIPAEKPKNTIKSTSIVVVPDEKVEIEYTPPTTEQLEVANAGQETVAGVEGADIIAPETIESGTGKTTTVEAEPVKETEFVTVEQNPEFLGGNAKMAQFLQKNLKYPKNAAQAGIQGRVFVTFTVGSDGKIENVKTIKGIGFGCDEEAERVMNLMPAWNPGKQGGRPVRVRFTMPIVFQLE